MNSLELILNYKNIIDGYQGIPLTKIIFNKTSILQVLKLNLKNEVYFNNVKDLIFNLQSYPIFVYCAKLYPNYFYNNFNMSDTSIYNDLLSFLYDLMVYNDSSALEIILSEPTLDSNPIQINNESIYINRLIALKYYNRELFDKLFKDATDYFNAYSFELLNLNTIEDTTLLNNFITIFKAFKTFHIKNKIITKLYLHLDNGNKNLVKLIFNTALISKDHDLELFKEDFEDLSLAYRFKNQ